MNTEPIDRDTAITIAEDYADEECVGQLGEIIDVWREETDWIVTFRTHTFSDEYEHRIRLNRAGHVFSHERDARIE